MKKILVILFFILMLLMIGCEHMKVQPAKEDTLDEAVQPLVGGDRDEHGCIPSAGYMWCESKQKCLRIWEEDCPGYEKPEIKTAEAPVDTSVEPVEKKEETPAEKTEPAKHEAIAKCEPGYEWCETLKKCLVQGEECPTEAYVRIAEVAKQFIGAKDVDSVYVCGPYIKVVSKLVGAGVTYHSEDLRRKFTCPVIAPEHMSDECKQAMGMKCFEVK